MTQGPKLVSARLVRQVVVREAFEFRLRLRGLLSAALDGL